MRTSFFVVVSLVVTTFAMKFASAAEWPGFGGTDANFSVTNSPSSFDRQPTVLWSRELGFGNSGIVEYDGVLFTTYRELDSTGTTSDSETVIAVDAETGETVWSLVYPEPPITGQNDYGGGRGPHATPFVTSDHVFTLGYAGSLHCLNRSTGDVVWKKNLVNDFDAEAVQFGFSASPIVMDGKLIVQASGTLGGLLALEPGSGETNWQSVPVGASYATPVLFEIAGERQLLFLSRDALQGIRLTDGKLRWEFKLPKEGLTNVPTPLLVGNGKIFIAGQGVGGAAMIQVTHSSEQFAVEEIWRNTRVNFFHNSFVVQNGIVFGGSSFLYGLSVKDGERLWTERGYELANVVGLGPLAILGPKDGRVVVAELGATGLGVRYSLDVFETEAWAPPTIVGDRLFARDREALAAISLNGEGPAGDVRGYLASKKELIQTLEQAGQSGANALLDKWERIDIPPVSQSAQLRMAQTLIETDQTQLADQLLSAIIDANTESLVARSKLGRLALVQGDRARASEVYAAAIDMDPSFEEGKRILNQLGAETEQSGNVTFRLSRLPDAKLVTVAGTFND